jgi:hypothetical protein
VTAANGRARWRQMRPEHGVFRSASKGVHDQVVAMANGWHVGWCSRAWGSEIHGSVAVEQSRLARWIGEMQWPDRQARVRERPPGWVRRHGFTGEQVTRVGFVSLAH